MLQIRNVGFLPILSESGPAVIAPINAPKEVSDTINSL